MTTNFDQQAITKFFLENMADHEARDHYMRSLTRSGYALLDRIPRNACILDVGCGKNLFKPYFENLVGIDVIGTECDIRSSLLDFHTDQKFDVILCLGSIFGSLDDICTQIQHMTTMLVPHGKMYWRNHPALPEFNPPGVEYPKFFYPWTEHTHHELCEKLGFTLNEVCLDYVTRDGRPTKIYRIYAEWTMQ